MPQHQQTLIDASIEVTNGQTIMKFTKIMAEPNEIPITMGENNIIWAYGSSRVLGYHASRGSYVQIVLGAPSGSSAVDVAHNKSACCSYIIGISVCITLLLFN
jgi:hypothetical protein